MLTLSTVYTIGMTSEVSKNTFLSLQTEIEQIQMVNLNELVILELSTINNFNIFSPIAGAGRRKS